MTKFGLTCRRDRALHQDSARSDSWGQTSSHVIFLNLKLFPYSFLPRAGLFTCEGIFLLDRMIKTYRMTLQGSRVTLVATMFFSFSTHEFSPE